MEPNAAERRHLERQITFARPIFMVLALVDLLELKPAGQSHRAMMFVAVYLGAALVLALVQNFLRKIELQLPLLVDLATAIGVRSCGENSAQVPAPVRRRDRQPQTSWRGDSAPLVSARAGPPVPKP